MHQRYPSCLLLHRPTTCGTSAFLSEYCIAVIRPVTGRHSLLTASCSRCSVCFLVIAYLLIRRGTSGFPSSAGKTIAADLGTDFRPRISVCPIGCSGTQPTLIRYRFGQCVALRRETGSIFASCRITVLTSVHFTFAMSAHPCGPTRLNLCLSALSHELYTPSLPRTYIIVSGPNRWSGYSVFSYVFAFLPATSRRTRLFDTFYMK